MLQILCIFVFLFDLVCGNPAKLQESYPKDDYFSPVDFTKAENVTITDVKFVCFNSEGHKVDITKLENHPTKILIHGWSTSIKKSPWYPLLRDAYLEEEEPINVIYVDYEPIAAKSYSIATASTKNVAKVITNHLLKSKIAWDNIHLIGHSMGSHVAGFIGRFILDITGKKIGRISLLDAAGPKFEKTEDIVNMNDACFMDVVHTDNGHYGLTKSVGHVDFFPNGGSHQVGCPSFEVDDNCSHARSTLYFIESIKRRHPIARRAKNWEEYLSGKYLDKEVITFGEYVPRTARGNYYFGTNSTSPYL